MCQITKNPPGAAGGLTPTVKWPTLPDRSSWYAYCSAALLVKFPLAPLALIWLLPKEMRDP
jgi:hypothetical protein